METIELNNNKPQPRETGTKPQTEKGDARRTPRQELEITALMKTACDNCTFTTDSHGKPIIVCTGRCQK